MKKQVKKYGNSLVVVFSKDECQIYDIKVGDILMIEKYFTTNKKIKEEELENAG